MFYSSRETRWTLKFCSSSIRRKQSCRRSRDFGTFRHLTRPQRSLVGLGPEVYIPIASSRGELHARFFGEALAHSGAKRHGGCPPPVPWKDAKWPVPARVNPALAGVSSQLPLAGGGGGGGASDAPWLTRERLIAARRVTRRSKALVETV